MAKGLDVKIARMKAVILLMFRITPFRGEVGILERYWVTQQMVEHQIHVIRSQIRMLSGLWLSSDTTVLL